MHAGSCEYRVWRARAVRGSASSVVHVDVVAAAVRSEHRGAAQRLVRMRLVQLLDAIRWVAIGYYGM